MKFSKEFVEKINHFILSNIERCPNSISEVTQSHFSLSKQTAFKYINALEKNNLIEKSKKGRYPEYKLINERFNFEYGNIKSLSEEKILLNDITPLLRELPKNIEKAFDYAFTEMVNNVIDHSNAGILKIIVEKNSVWTQISIIDDGIGIFNKIQHDLNLDRLEDSVLELLKGKFTSDAARHSGEGIFFTSKICDDFAIVSKNIIFKGDKLGAMVSEQNQNVEGTAVFLRMFNNSKTEPAEIFDEYSDFDKVPSFYKTKIPLKSMESGGIILVSRSQGKRLVNHLEKFTEIVLDFEDITEIGQGFADEVFRVFQNEYPHIKIIPVNCCERVKKMIAHVTRTV